MSVGTVAGSTSAAYLRDNRLRFQEFATAGEGLEAVLAGKLDTMVYDAPLLRYLVNLEPGRDIDVLPGTFQRQDYAIAMPGGSPAREKINRELVSMIQSPAWQDILYRYLGE